MSRLDPNEGLAMKNYVRPVYHTSTWIDADGCLIQLQLPPRRIRKGSEKEGGVYNCEVPVKYPADEVLCSVPALASTRHSTPTVGQ